MLYNSYFLHQLNQNHQDMLILYMLYLVGLDNYLHNLIEQLNLEAWLYFDTCCFHNLNLFDKFHMLFVLYN